MDVKQAYNKWADQYDSNENKTRDLEAISLKTNLVDIPFDNCLEIGCGTGKNTAWLLEKAKHVTAVDLSDVMLDKAKEKIHSDKVQFLQADIKNEWDFIKKRYDLITFCLILEHIENIDDIFIKASKAITPNGYVYIGELHPYKQYSGTKARFDTEDGQQIVTCYNHHISEFTTAAKNNAFDIVHVGEYFDENDRSKIPRILTLLLRNTNIIQNT